MYKSLPTTNEITSKVATMKMKKTSEDDYGVYENNNNNIMRDKHNKNVLNVNDSCAECGRPFASQGCLGRIASLFQRTTDDKNEKKMSPINAEQMRISKNRFEFIQEIDSGINDINQNFPNAKRLSIHKLIRKPNESEEEYELRKKEAKSLTNDSGYSEGSVLEEAKNNHVKSKQRIHKKTFNLDDDDDDEQETNDNNDDDEANYDDEDDEYGEEDDDIETETIVPLPMNPIEPDLDELIRNLDEKTLKLNNLFIANGNFITTN